MIFEIHLLNLSDLFLCADLENFALENYGHNSLCLRHGLPFRYFRCSKVLYSNSQGSGCYSVTCGKTAVTITLANNETVACTKELQVVFLKPTFANLSVNARPSSPTIILGSLVCPLCVNACPRNNQLCPMQRVSDSRVNTFEERFMDESNMPDHSVQIPCRLPSRNFTTAQMSPTSKSCFIIFNKVVSEFRCAL